MIPGIMIRIKANILMNVSETWVRAAKDTLQQFTATTNAKQKDTTIHIENLLWQSRINHSADLLMRYWSETSLTDCKDADQFHQSCWSCTRHEKWLDHITAKSQGQVGGHCRSKTKYDMLYVWLSQIQKHNKMHTWWIWIQSKAAWRRAGVRGSPEGRCSDPPIL